MKKLTFLKHWLWIILVWWNMEICVTQTRIVDGINYQAVALDENKKEIAGHDINGTVFYDKEIIVRFTIISGSPDGTIEYMETHRTLTDAFGLFSLTIGHGEPQMGVFSQIQWSKAPHFLKVEIDYKRNGEFLLMGIQQLMAVPYALYALSSGMTGVETDPYFQASPAAAITDAGSGKVITTDERNLIQKTDSLTRRLAQGLSQETAERQQGDRQLQQKQQSDSIHFRQVFNNEKLARQQEDALLRTILNHHITADQDTNATNELQQLSLTGTSLPQINLSKNGGSIILKSTGATSIFRSSDTLIISSSDANTNYTAGKGLQLTGTVFSVKTKGTTLSADSLGIAISSEGVGTAEIADNAVTTAKVQDGTITNADISSTAAISWSKIDKSGASASDIGALSTNLSSGNILVGNV
ncbi:MAG: hypothetical protein ACP5PZ_09920, partial [Bacteroidales bacterium]